MTSIKSTSLDVLKNRKPIPNNILKRIKLNGFLTGSAAFNCTNAHSDFDYIINVDDVDLSELSEYFAYDFKTYRGQEFQSYYVKDKSGNILNLLIMNNKKRI